MPNDSGMIIIAVAFAVALLGSGIGVAFLLGRRGGVGADKHQNEDESVSVERLVKELERCLELSDYVIRDADTLAAVLAAQSTAVARPIAGSVQQLIKTAKTLAGRLNRMGSDAGIARPQRDTRPVAVPIGKSGSDEPDDGRSLLSTWSKTT